MHEQMDGRVFFMKDWNRQSVFRTHNLHMALRQSLLASLGWREREWLELFLRKKNPLEINWNQKALRSKQKHEMPWYFNNTSDRSDTHDTFYNSLIE